MKILVLSTIVLLTGAAHAAPKFQCYGLGVHVAAKATGFASVKEFYTEYSEVWSCKNKNLIEEEVQFTDGSGMVGVSLKIENGKCKVVDVYFAQDDGDEIPDDSHICLR